MNVIGLDLSTKATHHAVALNSPNKELVSRQVTSTEEDLQALLDDVEEQTPPEEEIHVVMEATGLTWYLPALFFQNQGCKVYKIQAQRAKAFRDYMSKHTKTDSIDADCLARFRFVEPRSLDEICFWDSEHFGLKQLLKQREDFQEDIIRYKNRLRALMDGMIPQANGLTNRLVSKKKFWEVIPKLLNLSWVKQMGRKRFHNYVRRRDGDLTADEIDNHDACMEALRLHQENCADFDELHDQAQRYLEMIEFAEKKVDELTREIEEKVRVVDPDQSLQTLYGVGLLTAAYMEAYLSPIRRFDNLNKVHAWLGWMPKTLDSGQFESKGLGMSKAGPPGVRKQLYLATDTARQYDPQIAECYYRQMVEKGNPHTKALIAAGSKMLSRIVRVMRTGEPYELRDCQDNPVDAQTARSLARNKWKVPEKIRKRLRKKKAS